MYICPLPLESPSHLKWESYIPFQKLLYLPLTPGSNNSTYSPLSDLNFSGRSPSILRSPPLPRGIRPCGRIDALRCRVAFPRTLRDAELERLNRAGPLLYLGQKAGGPMVPSDPDVCSPQAAPKTLSWRTCKPRKQRGKPLREKHKCHHPSQGRGFPRRC